MVGRDARINLLISTGHFLSHFYQLCLPPLFLVWQRQFDISFAELGLSVVLMTGTAAVLQTPVGFLVDRYGARPFLIGGALVMSIAIALMAFATAFWQILALALISAFAVAGKYFSVYIFPTTSGSALLVTLIARRLRGLC